MPAFWFNLKKSLPCKSNALKDVQDPMARRNLGDIQTRKLCRSGCSRSISNLREVISGSKRHVEKFPVCSPRSLGSCDFLNPITHEVILNDSTCELRIAGFCGNAGSTSVDGFHSESSRPGRRDSVLSTRSHSLPRTKSSYSRIHGNSSGSGIQLKSSTDADFYGLSGLTCKKCSEKFKNSDAAEAHHLSNHAVTELSDGDSSRKIIEIICRTSWVKSENNRVGIERILKVHNMQKRIFQFEEQREVVKIKASRLHSKHQRCLADGNELLRFHGTTVACSLGKDGSSTICALDDCDACQILRNGFVKDEHSIGIFTTSTGQQALETAEVNVKSGDSVRKVLVVCRVIAGRVHRPLDNIQEMAGQSGFDSLAGKFGHQSHIEELYVLDPKALLPCFLVICKPEY